MSFDDLKDLDSIVVAVGHNEFRALSATDLMELTSSHNPVVADVKGLYQRESLIDAGFTVFRL